MAAERGGISRNQNTNTGNQGCKPWGRKKLKSPQTNSGRHQLSQIIRKRADKKEEELQRRCASPKPRDRVFADRWFISVLHSKQPDFYHSFQGEHLCHWMIEETIVFCQSKGSSLRADGTVKLLRAVRTPHIFCVCSTCMLRVAVITEQLLKQDRIKYIKRFRASLYNCLSDDIMYEEKDWVSKPCH